MSYAVVVSDPIHEEVDLYGPYTFEDAQVVKHAVEIENRVQRPLPSVWVQKLEEFGDDDAAAE